MFGRLGWPQLLIILVIFIMIFGLGKLPQVGASIGKSIRAFKKSQEEDDDGDEVEALPKKRKTTSKKKTKTDESI
ncbi:MAG: twin-arginine translocase TatA/TatE family subunit [Dehalococcoidia bacterium]|nr:twin-arginine translocase TatA/TatE family subunit [Dehalococcoidia bacterium]